MTAWGFNSRLPLLPIPEALSARLMNHQGMQMFLRPVISFSAGGVIGGPGTGEGFGGREGRWKAEI